jgi:lysozyme family protein
VDIEDIKLLPEPIAILIYKALYWESLDLDVVQDKKLAICAFDTGVNCGVSRTDRWLSNTETAGKGHVYFLNFRVMHYLDIIKRNPEKYAKYKNGWLRRVNELKKYVDDPEVIDG